MKKKWISTTIIRFHELKDDGNEDQTMEGTWEEGRDRRIIILMKANITPTFWLLCPHQSLTVTQ
jgi:hypothetical protein